MQTPHATKTSLRDYLRASWRLLLKEVMAFGLVGSVGFAIDIVLFNVFFHEGQVIAKCISTTVATIVTYFGNRYFSFSHRARTSIGRETSVFFGINILTLLFSLAVIAIFEYPLGFKHDVVVMNVVNLGTIAIGTMFRFWSYKRFVFLHPDKAKAKNLVKESDRSRPAPRVQAQRQFSADRPLSTDRIPEVTDQ
ncbi:GtrA family protein [Jatrophihabitans sp. DSM 45814]